jgi:hypothetical protein
MPRTNTKAQTESQTVRRTQRYQWAWRHLDFEMRLALFFAHRLPMGHPNRTGWRSRARDLEAGRSNGMGSCEFMLLNIVCLTPSLTLHQLFTFVVSPENCIPCLRQIYVAKARKNPFWLLYKLAFPTVK